MGDQEDHAGEQGNQTDEELERVEAALRRPRSSSRAWRWVGGIVGLIALTIVGVWGPVAYHDYKQRAEDCLGKKGQVTAQANFDNFEQAENALDAARRLCGSEATEELDALERELATKRRAAADKARERALARERGAFDAFPDDAVRLRQTLKSAAEALAKNDVAKAARLVVSARTVLDGYRGTSIVKGEEWRELSDQAEALQKKVQPYLDAQRALVEQVQKEIAERTDQERRDGIKVTKPGYVAAATLEKLERAVKYAAANDKEGLSLLIQQDQDVLQLPGGLRVSVIERGGGFGQYLHVRVRGTLTEFWTLPEALREP